MLRQILQARQRHALGGHEAFNAIRVPTAIPTRA